MLENFSAMLMTVAVRNYSPVVLHT